MRRDLAAAAQLLVVPTLAVLVVVGLLPGRAELAIRIYAVFVAVLALALGIAALRRAFPPATPLRRARGDRRERPVPPSLARMENAVALGHASAFDLHHRLRPRLRGLAEGLLRSRRAISLDRQPDRARTVLGDATWELVESDRPPPEDRRARGLETPALRGVVESLERV